MKNKTMSACAASNIVYKLEVITDQCAFDLILAVGIEVGFFFH